MSLVKTKFQYQFLCSLYRFFVFCVFRNVRLVISHNSRSTRLRVTAPCRVPRRNCLRQRGEIQENHCKTMYITLRTMQQFYDPNC